MGPRAGQIKCSHYQDRCVLRNLVVRLRVHVAPELPDPASAIGRQTQPGITCHNHTPLRSEAPDFLKDVANITIVHVPHQSTSVSHHDQFRVSPPELLPVSLTFPPPAGHLVMQLAVG